MKLGLLGPDGSFSSEAGYNYVRREEFKSKLKFYSTISDCFTGLEKNEIDFAIIPLLNSSGGAEYWKPKIQKIFYV